AEVSPAELRQSIDQAVQAPEYDWRLPPAPAAANMPWIVRITDRLVAASRRVLDAIGSAFDRFFRWLADKLRNAPPTAVAGGPPAAGLSWIVALLMAIALAAAAFALQQHRSRGTG